MRKHQVCVIILGGSGIRRQARTLSYTSILTDANTVKRAQIKSFQIKAAVQILCKARGQHGRTSRTRCERELRGEREDVQGKQHEEGVTVV